MTFNFIRDHRLLSRQTLVALVLALASIWLVALYLIRIVHGDMEKLVGDQQLSTASIVAQSVNSELQDRMNVLTNLAGQVNKELLDKPASLQAFLKNHSSASLPFNGGIFITDTSGTAVADFPVVAGRVGTNYMDRESISVPLKTGKTLIGRPNLGKTLKAPIFSIVVPVLDGQGAVIGSIAGTVNLGLPNFLDKLATGRYGKKGGYLLIAPQYRLIVTATDKSRVMESLPAVGVIPEMDRMLAGFQGTSIFVNAKGVEVMNSGVIVPISGWRVVVSVPTEEVYAAISDMRMRVMVVALMAALIATVLAVTLAMRLFKTQLSAQLALYDPLTNLANRRLMEDRLHQTMAASQRYGSCFAVMVLDLDNFKPLNDQHGHGAGDLLLVEAAHRLERCVRHTDTVARYGGDEFVVILGELSADVAAATEQARAVAEKIRAKLTVPYVLQLRRLGSAEITVEHCCTASIGIAMAVNHEVGADDIIKHADAAMYQAKNAGRNAICFFVAKA